MKHLKPYKLFESDESDTISELKDILQQIEDNPGHRVQINNRHDQDKRSDSISILLCGIWSEVYKSTCEIDEYS